MKLEKIFKNIEKQNELRKELGQKELVLNCTLFNQKYQFKTYKEFTEVLFVEAISYFAKDILNNEFENFTKEYVSFGYFKGEFEFRVEEE